MNRSPQPSLKRVWVDVDIAAGLPGRDIDDAMGMLQLFHAEDVYIVGVGTVFGNTDDVDYVQETAQYMVSKFARYDIPVFRGASSAAQLFTPSPASNALSQLITLSESMTGITAPLLVFATGPVTNIATAFWQAGDAAVQRNVKEVIVVAGRTPNDRFIAGCTEFPDLNFDSDPEAFAYLLSMPKLPLVLVPYELSSKDVQVPITSEDVNILRSQGGDAGEFVFNLSQPWLSYWTENFQLPYINLFDAMAGLRIIRPHVLSCSKLQAWIDYTPDFAQSPPPRLHCSKDARNEDRSTMPDPVKCVLYCHTPLPGAKEALLETIVGRDLYNIQINDTPEL